jgi:hypothetical protein
MTLARITFFCDYLAITFLPKPEVQQIQPVQEIQRVCNFGTSAKLQHSGPLSDAPRFHKNVDELNNQFDFPSE